VSLSHSWLRLYMMKMKSFWLWLSNLGILPLLLVAQIMCIVCL